MPDRVDALFYITILIATKDKMWVWREYNHNGHEDCSHNDVMTESLAYIRANIAGIKSFIFLRLGLAAWDPILSELLLCVL